LGFKIAVLYNSAPEKSANDLLSSLPGSGHAIYKCNLDNKNEVAQTLEKIQAEQPGIIFGCIHAAWTKPERKQLSKVTSDDILKQFNENIPASFNFISLFAEHFKKQKTGVIVGITTAGVVDPQSIGNLAGYIPAKYALQGILASYREELSEAGVQVYSVAPGFMEGGMNKDIPKAFVEIIKRKSPGKTLITPDNVAEKVAELFTEQGTGQKEFTYLITPNAV
jgi:NAD(P)-dependent dehydrogenase (short-subunit alcohol dehydrogenase family)